ncbi:glycosyltransferase family 2 protein [Streptomyces radicis]|uniref:Glycosyltransferase family 2 protein n=1 Tax=Streptomyces radicis TaxID=1750517 RepID=A0A3A9WPJ5_9ACTN|nr:glycosyltransferase family 2 protein [Streptomyces radicis]RKN11424.1 glycosyltransferase family 2 protein [Streptomyces radicis]RKN26556.1 glycosyltransferase family 2 protein [Streptomyces radicis]
MPKLSVIVACHNVQDFVPTTLRSLERNAGPDTEFILVDDRSTDATGEILGRAEGKLPQARVLRHDTNLGISQARNTGIEAASGDYVTFLDGDDWYAPGYLDQLTAAAESIDCDYVRTDHVQSNGKRRTVVRAPAPRRGVAMSPRDAIAPADRKTMVDYPFVWAGAYRRSLFDDGLRFQTHLRTAEDRVFCWQLQLRATSFASVGLLGMFYRRGVTTSLTQIRDDRQLDFLPAHDLILDEVMRDRESERFLPKIVRTYCAMIAFHAANAERYEPDAARRLKQESTAALRRFPPQLLERTLVAMGDERGRVLRRLLGRVRKAA